VLNPNGTVRGDGTASSRFFGSYFLHQGLEYDPATGLYYDRMRYYDPALGRFTQEDPAGDVNGVNTYLGEEDSPIDGLDPWGLDDYPPNWNINDGRLSRDPWVVNDLPEAERMMNEAYNRSQYYKNRANKCRQGTNARNNSQASSNYWDMYNGWAKRAVELDTPQPPSTPAYPPAPPPLPGGLTINTFPGMVQHFMSNSGAPVNLGDFFTNFVPQPRLVQVADVFATGH